MLLIISLFLFKGYFSIMKNGMYESDTYGIFFYGYGSNLLKIRNSIFENIQTSLPLIHNKGLRLE